MLSIGDFYLFFKVRWQQFIEERRVRTLFYHNRALRTADQAVQRAYTFANPYRISRLFLQKREAPDIHLYGETPLTTLARIAEECELSPSDHFLDLGCGRGRAVFFIAHHCGCRATGIEQIPTFVAKAQRINRCERITFQHADMLQAELRGATVIYLYGTCLEDAAIEALIARFAQLPVGTKIITVSYSLLEYTNAHIFALRKHFNVSYPWGNAEVYIQERT